MKMVPYKIVRAPNGDAWVEAYGRQYSLVEIVATILSSIKDDIGKCIRKTISNAIITLSREISATQVMATLNVGDFDNAIMEYMVSELKRTEYVDISKDRLAVQWLRQAAEAAKVELSSRSETEINLSFATTDAPGGKPVTITLTRSTFESLVTSLIGWTRNLCESYLRNNAGITTDHVDEVFLVGGMARVPKVQEVLAEIYI
ncbi:hypothetical protein IFM89_015079 [Coptis chinensis]|uniref:Heat shock protein 70 n=1 Tax=Coptis chinensis TaxID=261450 RepID=A0A835M074_9MAGN|nr:hypothetical protein IFM89_015079 [Coptis chinensis]